MHAIYGLLSISLAVIFCYFFTHEFLSLLFSVSDFLHRAWRAVLIGLFMRPHLLHLFPCVETHWVGVYTDISTAESSCPLWLCSVSAASAVRHRMSCQFLECSEAQGHRCPLLQSLLLLPFIASKVHSFLPLCRPWQFVDVVRHKRVYFICLVRCRDCAHFCDHFLVMWVFWAFNVVPSRVRNKTW